MDLWAEIFYKNRKAYVFSKYLKNVETTELDVVEDVWVTIKVVVVQPVQGTVVRHVLVVVKKVAEYLVRGNAESLHVKVFVRILVIGDSVMVVVLVHVNHLVRTLVLHV